MLNPKPWIITAASAMLVLVMLGQEAWTEDIDRERLLSALGVFVTFAVFSRDDEWRRMNPAERAAAGSAVRQVVGGHSSRVLVETYLARGLSDLADLFVRLHARDLSQNQDFLVDFMSSRLGRHLKMLQVFNGLTKPTQYVPAFSEELKKALSVPVDPGAKPYAIVIPVRKDAEWWQLDRETRLSLMREHAEASVPYLKTVARKLYHATGLDDLDFVTYLERLAWMTFTTSSLAFSR